jgi:hypothetical protein
MWWPSRASRVQATGAPPDRPRGSNARRAVRRSVAAGVTEVCFAGAMSRPPLDPTALDDVTKALMPRLMRRWPRATTRSCAISRRSSRNAALPSSAPMPCAPTWWRRPGCLAGGPLPEADVARARAVLDALGPLDVGQGRSAARGQVLGIETLQGTDAMLDFVARTAPAAAAYWSNGPSPGRTCASTCPPSAPTRCAGRGRRAWPGSRSRRVRVLLLDPDAVLAACAETGLSLWAAP